MIDPRHYRADETLRDGRAVVVRAIRASDKQAMLEAYRSLTPETVYMRLFAAHGDPTAKDLREWTEVDFDVLVRLVVSLPGPDGSERILGGASYALLAPGNPAAGAEISFTLEEEFQGQGLAGKLLQHLALIARANGIPQFVAETLPENHAMVAVFAKSGLPMTRKRADGVVHVTLALTLPA